MCKCENVDFGSYDAQVWIIDISAYPQMVKFRESRGASTDRGICLDACVADEVIKLWELGITTTGCCCGHNKLPAYIGVIDADIVRMKELGFIAQPNPNRAGEDSFYPKDCQYKDKPY